MQNVLFETTQNVQLQTEKAGIGKRIFAIIIDYFILTAFSILLMLIFDSTNVLKTEYLSIIIGIIFFTYHLFFELFTEGRSIGKISQKIRVVKNNGESASFFQYFIRALLRPIDSIFGLGLVVMAFTKNGQRLGDLLANTVLIKDSDIVEFNDLAITEIDQAYQAVLSRSQIEALKSTDIELIKKIIREAEQTMNYHILGKTYTKVKEVTQSDSDLLPIKFLRAVVQDYSYYYGR
jgi:uncharacterized RDD family membrane protein YckC